MKRLTKRDYCVIADALNFIIVGENPFLESEDEADRITDEELKAVLAKVEERE
jgi:hypothetical protein